MQTCKNIVVSAVKQVLIAPLGATKETATDLGFTGDTVTFTAALSYTEVRVDQRLGIVRRVPTEATYSGAIPLRDMSLSNLALGLGVDFDSTGLATIANEKYYQLWIITKGVVNADGAKSIREFYIPQISIGGTAELSFSRTETQQDNLEFTVVNCEDSGIFQVTDTYDESESI